MATPFDWDAFIEATNRVQSQDFVVLIARSLLAVERDFHLEGVLYDFLVKLIPICQDKNNPKYREAYAFLFALNWVREQDLVKRKELRAEFDEVIESNYDSFDIHNLEQMIRETEE